MTCKPDEIKRGLNDPIHVHYHHGDREPHMTPLAMIDLEQLHADALALIQQLEAELTDAKNNHQHTIDIAERQKSQIDKLKKVVVRLNTELNEAVETVKRMACCGGCVHLQEEPDQICIDLDFDCERCKKQCACYRCKDGSNYEWRGVQKEG